MEGPKFAAPSHHGGPLLLLLLLLGDVTIAGHGELRGGLAKEGLSLHVPLLSGPRDGIVLHGGGHRPLHHAEAAELVGRGSQRAVDHPGVPGPLLVGVALVRVGLRGRGVMLRLGVVGGNPLHGVRWLPPPLQARVTPPVDLCPLLSGVREGVRVDGIIHLSLLSVGGHGVIFDAVVRVMDVPFTLHVGNPPLAYAPPLRRRSAERALVGHAPGDGVLLLLLSHAGHARSPRAVRVGVVLGDVRGAVCERGRGVGRRGRDHVGPAHISALWVGTNGTIPIVAVIRIGHFVRRWQASHSI